MDVDEIKHLVRELEDALKHIKGGILTCDEEGIESIKVDGRSYIRNSARDMALFKRNFLVALDQWKIGEY